MAPFVTLLIGVCFPSFLSAQDTDRDGLSDNWERGFGRYEIVLGSFTWQEARTDAELKGAHLATVVSEMEWNDIKRVLGASLHRKNLWLGGTDEGSEGNWRWITGENWSFTNWRVGEPGNDSLWNGQRAPENFLISCNLGCPLSVIFRSALTFFDSFVALPGILMVNTPPNQHHHNLKPYAYCELK